MKPAWYVMCVDRDTPDGPARWFGPFPDIDLALTDTTSGGCENRHQINRGCPPPNVHINRSSGDHVTEAMRHYATNPHLHPAWEDRHRTTGFNESLRNHLWACLCLYGRPFPRDAARNVLEHAGDARPYRLDREPHDESQ